MHNKQQRKISVFEKVCKVKLDAVVHLTFNMICMYIYIPELLMCQDFSLSLLCMCQGFSLYPCMCQDFSLSLYPCLCQDFSLSLYSCMCQSDFSFPQYPCLRCTADRIFTYLIFRAHY